MGESCYSSSLSAPKAPYLYKLEKVGQGCRKEVQMAKAGGDLHDVISLETVVPKATCHLLAALMASSKPSLILNTWW